MRVKKNKRYLYLMVLGALFVFFLTVFDATTPSLYFYLSVGLFFILLFLVYLNFFYLILIAFVILPLTFKLSQLQLAVGFLLFFLDNKTLSFDLYTLFYFFLMVVIFIEILVRKPKIHQKPLFWIILAAIFLNLLSFVTSVNRLEGINEVIIFLGSFGAYYLGLVFFNSKKKYVQALSLVLMSSIIPILTGVFQIITGSFFYSGDVGLPRIRSTFFQPNNFGMFLMIVSICALGLLLAVLKDQKNKKVTVILSISLLISVIFLLLTFNRSSWINFALAVGVFSLIKKEIRKYTIFGGLMIVAIIFLFDIFRNRIFELFDPYMYDTIYVRAEIWDKALFAFKKKPLLGYGFGMFEEVIRSVQGYEEGLVHSHSDHFQVLIERGIVGWIGYLLMMIGALYYSYKGIIKKASLRFKKIKFFNRTLNLDFKILTVIPLILFINMSLASFVEAPQVQYTFQFFSWFLLGSCLNAGEKELINKKEQL
ncbi:MAG: hypothetical protein GF335_04080 [Candidatus Moranbacteria bacterium]|nr:hypothetical protein [Candidatus Moranbacteria bacterium]